jgi:hypothetical protein
MVVSFAIFLIGFAWYSRAAYHGIMDAVAEVKAGNAALHREIEGLKARNLNADREATEIVKRQHLIELSQATANAQIAAIIGSLEKMDRNIETLLKRA